MTFEATVGVIVTIATAVAGAVWWAIQHAMKVGEW
jgi:hypothetical protein